MMQKFTLNENKIQKHYFHPKAKNKTQTLESKTKSVKLVIWIDIFFSWSNSL